MTTTKTTENPYNELRYKIWKRESAVAFLAEISSLENSNWIEVIENPMTQWDFDIHITQVGEECLKDIPAQITLLDTLAKGCIDSGLMHRFEKTDAGWQVIWTNEGDEVVEEIQKEIFGEAN